MPGMEVAMAVGVGGALLGPLGYALVTLSRLQHKKAYPVVRYVGRDGYTAAVKVPADPQSTPTQGG